MIRPLRPLNVNRLFVCPPIGVQGKTYSAVVLSLRRPLKM
jgi:hypothetical protein